MRFFFRSRFRDTFGFTATCEEWYVASSPDDCRSHFCCLLFIGVLFLGLFVVYRRSVAVVVDKDDRYGVASFLACGVPFRVFVLFFGCFYFFFYFLPNMR